MSKRMQCDVKDVCVMKSEKQKRHSRHSDGLMWGGSFVLPVQKS